MKKNNIKKKVLAVITARGGSKGVLKKNIRPVGGKPLIAWMIEAAKKAKLIDCLILSSDDADIISIAEKYGCDAPFVRPSSLAQDDSLTIDVMLHALQEIPGYDYVALLQPTSPLTISRHIDDCIQLCMESGAETVVSVCETSKSPYWMFEMNEQNYLIPCLDKAYLNKRRQDLPKAFIPSGAIYVADCEMLMKKKSFYTDSTIGYEISREHSLDIDTELDFKVFESLVGTMKLKGEKKINEKKQ